MKLIKCSLPDVNFNISVEDEYYDLLLSKVKESVIDFKPNTEESINIEYIVDIKKFIDLKNKIKNSDGKVYDTFKKQTHKEIILNNKKYYLVNTEEYICIKATPKDYIIIVEKNNVTSTNWVVRIIRELYLRIKENKGYNYMHGTGIEVNGKGILLLGNSGSGKTTLAVKFLELEKSKGFLSNDRILIDKNLNIDYFPHATTYAMGTVKNNKHLDKYFKDTNILEKTKKISYETVEYTVDCNTPLADTEKIFNNTYMVARSDLSLILYPRFKPDVQNVEVFDMTRDEKIEFLESTDFTPEDREALRKPWLMLRNKSDKELLIERNNLINCIIDNVKIKKIVYGAKSSAIEIIEKLGGI